QFHRGPVLLSDIRAQRQPGEVFDVARQSGMPFHGKLAVIVTGCRPGSTASAMAQQGDILTWLEPSHFTRATEGAKLHKVIPAPARPKLRPRAIPVPPSHRTDIPVGIHHGMIAPLLEGGTDSEAGLFGD